MWSLIPTLLGETSGTVQTLGNVDFSITSISCDTYVPGLFVVLYQLHFCPWESNGKLESNFAEKHPGVPVISKPSRSQQGALTTKAAIYILGCTSVDKCHQLLQGNDPAPLFSTCETTSGYFADYSVLFASPQQKKSVAML